jgi:hypothetical protein
VGICGAMSTSFQQIQSASALMSKQHRLSNISDRYAQGWSLRQFVTSKREPARKGCAYGPADAFVIRSGTATCCRAGAQCVTHGTPSGTVPRTDRQIARAHGASAFFHWISMPARITPPVCGDRRFDRAAPLRAFGTAAAHSGWVVLRSCRIRGYISPLRQLRTRCTVRLSALDSRSRSRK